VSVDESHPDDTYYPPDIPLSREERTELLTHRCYIVTDKRQTDLWPFDDTFDEAKPDQWWLRE
jgi:hypothetical protein